MESQFVKTSNVEIWERNVYYIGKPTDTFRIYEMNNLKLPLKDHEVLIQGAPKDSLASYLTNPMEIKVDTNTVLPLRELEWWTEARNTKYYKSHPIFITNNSDSTTIVGYGYNIPIILEAKDQKGEWKPIEKQYYYSCGVGLHYIVLHPGEVIFVLGHIYSGSFKTTLRYKLGDSYSATFFGSISPQQFVVTSNTMKY
jgi:hypothetical protein